MNSFPGFIHRGIVLIITEVINYLLKALLLPSDRIPSPYLCLLSWLQTFCEWFFALKDRCWQPTLSGSSIANRLYRSKGWWHSVQDVKPVVHVCNTAYPQMLVYVLCRCLPPAGEGGNWPDEFYNAYKDGRSSILSILEGPVWEDLSYIGSWYLGEVWLCWT